MADELQILRKRFKELNQRSYNRGVYTYSDFLGMHEQTVLYEEMKYGIQLHGGYPDAERCVAVFGNSDDLGYEPTLPVQLIEISPLSQKFSDDLTHRDFLGSLMGLGIKRETLGDIIISGNKGYLFCLDSIGQYIIDNLTKVRHTSVSCSFTDSLPVDALPKPKESVIIVQSMRLDGLVSAVYNMSRSKSSALVDGEKVFINGRLSKSSSKPVETGDIVSVRGHGRFKILDILGDTRKGRIRIKCEIYK